jgi:hypothetical protein
MNKNVKRLDTNIVRREAIDGECIESFVRVNYDLMRKDIMPPRKKGWLSLWGLIVK